MPKKKINDIAKTVAINVQLEAKPDVPFYYVNYMAVGQTIYDFSISVAKLPSLFTPEQLAEVQKGQPITVEPILQLVMPPRVAKGLIVALTDQVRKYESQFGEISIKGPENEKNK